MSTTVDLGIAHIKTTIARDDKQVDECIQALISNDMNRKRLIGLDTIFSDSDILLQLCDESQCFIFRLNHSRTPPQSLYNFLNLPAFTFVGFAIKDALALLRKPYGFVCKNYLEAGYSGKPSSLIPVNVVVSTMYIPPTLSNLGGDDLINLLILRP